MGRRAETPYDDVAGIPIALPLLPNDRIGEHSWHHTAHPRDHHLLQDAGGMAVRVARLQLVEGPGGAAIFLNEDNDVHENAAVHSRYHLAYDGPPLPENDFERFGYCLMLLAQYIPEYGIDLSGKYPVERKIRVEEIERLRSGQFRTGYNTIQDFFTGHILGDQAANYDSRDVDDFLETERGIRRIHIGDRIINQAILEAVQPWARPYKDARKKGRLKPDANPSIVDLARRAFGRETTRHNFIDRLHKKLAGPALQTEVKLVPSTA